jgi:hypothetical protein
VGHLLTSPKKKEENAEPERRKRTSGKGVG